MKSAVALILVFALAGCAGSDGPDKRSAAELIAKARRAERFAPYAPIFPRQAGKKRCGVRAGPRGNTFWGVCSSYVVRRGDDASTVEFLQDFGTGAAHRWDVRVSRDKPAYVTNESGGVLVQLVD